MAKIIGKWPEGKAPGLVSTLLSCVNEKARLQAEAVQGEGLRRVLPLVTALPNTVTALVRPTLGFMTVDWCLVGPGCVVVLQTLHWSGKATVGEKGEWVSGRHDLGRPDRKAYVFADRLRFSGHAHGFKLSPVVVTTAGRLQLSGVKPLVPLIPWDETQAYLNRSFPAGVSGLADATDLVRLLSSRH